MIKSYYLFEKARIMELIENQQKLIKELELERIDNDLLNVDKYEEEYKVLYRLQNRLEELNYE